MSDSISPRRKLRVRWVVGGLCLLCVSWFFYQLFGSKSDIVISKETTFITEPLGKDGLPDYEAYLLQQDSEGVTPENNAAVLLWQAMWPGELEQEYWLPLCNALGMEEVPSEKESLVSVYDESVRNTIAIELAKRFADQTVKNFVEGTTDEDWLTQLRDLTADELIDEASQRPWNSKQISALVQWIQQNQKPLDLLLEASKRPRYFSPSPTTLDNNKDVLIAMLLPDIQMMRTVARTLPVRAMWHLGEGRAAEAWEDLLAVYRIARLTGENGTLVGQLVAIAIDGIALNATHTLLGSEGLSQELSRKILKDLQNLGPRSSMLQVLDKRERLFFLDSSLAIAAGEESLTSLSSFTGAPPNRLETIALSGLDWNLILRNGNHWYDKIVAAAKQSTREQRNTKLAQVDTELTQTTKQFRRPSAWLGNVMSSQRRSRTVGNILANLFVPATSSALNAEDRNNTLLELTRLAAALAVYRAEQGEYPEKLTELIPSIIPKLPLDLYSGKSFLYERKNDGGYLLYSVFEDGDDDKGTRVDAAADTNGSIFKGEWIEPDSGADLYEIDGGDLVIRVPVPKFKFPEPPTNETENW